MDLTQQHRHFKKSIFTRTSWRSIGIEPRTKWTLELFEESSPPTWELFWQEQREYWGADANNHDRFQLYFGDDDPEKIFICKAKEDYQKLCRHFKLWHGLCEAGDHIEIIPVNERTIILSKDWKGSISDHSDLEITIHSDGKFFGRKKRLYGEIYSFGTILNPADSIQVAFGEKAGSFRVSHRRGSSADKRETICRSKDKIFIGDAVFAIDS